ncbi:MAG: NADH:ubiquinone reductase (Na(+)-transporting) subunit F, partial [Deltaproteobacteria bacterium]|nr:NADH:ubiquinone reductase (Na(+)-transporting) subunit F [Deltaproteobacteria bacterium]
MIYVVSLIVFSAVIFTLVGMLLLVEAKVVKSDDCMIVINDDEDKPLKVPGGPTLLSVLTANHIFLPSACGGGGTCGTCKCVVEEGGRGVLPTEIAHLTRREKKENVRLSCQIKVKEDLRIRIPDEIFNVRKYNATVISNENVATFIKELVLRLDPGESLEFRAGAFIQIDVPEYELSYSEFRVRVAERFRPDWDAFNLWGLHAVADEPIFRAYSLANPPAEKSVLQFTIRIATPPPGVSEAPTGVGSSFIFNMKPGDRVTLSGPYGEFFVKETDQEMCFVGGGAGMAPLRSHIFHQLSTLKTKRKITFWYGARSKLELFFENEFKDLENEFDNFSFYAALSQPKDGEDWDGLTGYIHQCLYDNYLKS